MPPKSSSVHQLSELVGLQIGKHISRLSLGTFESSCGLILRLRGLTCTSKWHRRGDSHRAWICIGGCWRCESICKHSWWHGAHGLLHCLHVIHRTGTNLSSRWYTTHGTIWIWSAGGSTSGLSLWHLLEVLKVRILERRWVSTGLTGHGDGSWWNAIDGWISIRILHWRPMAVDDRWGVTDAIGVRSHWLGRSDTAIWRHGWILGAIVFPSLVNKLENRQFSEIVNTWETHVSIVLCEFALGFFWMHSSSINLPKTCPPSTEKTELVWNMATSQMTYSYSNPSGESTGALAFSGTFASFRRAVAVSLYCRFVQ